MATAMRASAPGKSDLTLRILHQHALMLAASVVIDADCALDAQLFGVHLSPEQRVCLSEQPCSVRWRGNDDNGGWWLHCNSQRWCCAINDVVLPCGQNRLLRSGDCIELGLLKLQVGTADAVPEQTGDSVSPHGVDAVLAALLPDPASADPFSVLPTLTDLALEPASQSQTVLHQFSDEDVIDGKYLEAIDCSTEAAAQATMDRQALPTPGDDNTQQPDADALSTHQQYGHVAQRLGEQYLLAIQAPDALTNTIAQSDPPLSLQPDRPWQQAGDHDALPCDALQLDALVPLQCSLEDLVSGELSIDQMLDCFGTQTWQLPQQEALPEVLSLFAPPGTIRPSRTVLPPLTLREHHAFSPDSAYRAATNSGNQGQVKSDPDNTP